jgi:activator of HSP90 ATPase
MKPIRHSIEFRGVSTEQLFETYLDSRKHGAAIGDEASIQRRVGGRFSAFGEGNLVGKFLHLVPNRMIVQTWRSLQRWREDELDSILVLTFEPTARGARLNLVHSGVPARDFDLFSQGWRARYWKPWKEYFRTRSRQR